MARILESGNCGEWERKVGGGSLVGGGKSPSEHNLGEKKLGGHHDNGQIYHQLGKDIQQ